MPQSVSAGSPRPAFPASEFVHVSVEVEALAAPDTLSRLMEPIVVLQVMPTRVEAAIDPGGETMSVRIHLGSDLSAAERVVRKLAGAVTVISARLACEPKLAAAMAS